MKDSDKGKADKSKSTENPGREFYDNAKQRPGDDGRVSESYSPLTFIDQSGRERTVHRDALKNDRGEY